MEDATMVVFGASGDMARRLLFPALYELEQARRLGGLKIIAYARRDWTREQCLHVIRDGIARLAGIDTAKSTWERFAHRIEYVRGDLTVDEIEQLRPMLAENAAFYLALPPGLFLQAATALAEAGFNDQTEGWRRLVLEKPFGEDLESALALNRSLHEQWSEEQIFRIDHYLGKETVQNVLVFRFANRFLDPVFNCHHVDYVEITAAETLGLEGRVTFYEGIGALRDMLQSHLIQLLALVAMEPLAVWDDELLHNHKAEVLRSVRPILLENVEEHAVRGQYAAGARNGTKMRGYRDEDGIDAGSTTETFAALKLYIDNWRWHGTPFYLRSGKRLTNEVTEIAVHFRKPPFRPFGKKSAPAENHLVFRLRPHESINLEVLVRKPGFEMETEQLLLHADYPSSDSSSSAYRQLILDLLEGERTAFLRFDEVEWAWRIITPVLEAWEKGRPEPYAAGSEGPEGSLRLLSDGHQWRALSVDAIPEHDR
jgi:glucose-6-phosphate 1-dehydrogenase